MNALDQANVLKYNARLSVKCILKSGAASVQLLQLIFICAPHSLQTDPCQSCPVPDNIKINIVHALHDYDLLPAERII